MAHSRTATIAVACLVLAVIPTTRVVAGQEPPRQLGELTIYMADLDLQSHAGALALLGRIEAAAKAFCGPRPHVLELRPGSYWVQCVEDAMDGAVIAVDKPLVSDLYERHPLYASSEY